MTDLLTVERTLFRKVDFMPHVRVCIFATIFKQALLNKFICLSFFDKWTTFDLWGFPEFFWLSHSIIAKLQLFFSLITLFTDLKICPVIESRNVVAFAPLFLIGYVGDYWIFTKGNFDWSQSFSSILALYSWISELKNQKSCWLYLVSRFIFFTLTNLVLYHSGNPNRNCLQKSNKNWWITLGLYLLKSMLR